MVLVDALEEVNRPQEIQLLLKRLLLHTVAEDDHALDLVDGQEEARFHSSGRCSLSVQLLHLLLTQILLHIGRDFVPLVFEILVYDRAFL